MATASAPIPAATVVIMRERAGRAAQLLMVERARAMTFAAGALVFPGGRIDPGDRALAEALGPEAPGDAAARIAAIRETIEEAGIAIGLRKTLSDADRRAIRDRLHAGDPFGALLPGGAEALAIDRLVPFARWRPEFVHSRVFDTRFYLARLPENAGEPKVDATENVRAFWATAAETLAAADAGEAHIIFPTRRNLERLSRFDGFADAAADARAHEIRTITPWFEERGGERHLCIPEDAGYPVTSQVAEAARRG